MLNVSLGTGTLEIRSALLNTDYLTQQLVCLSPYVFCMLRAHLAAWQPVAGFLSHATAMPRFGGLVSHQNRGTTWHSTISVVALT
jgi:hypothetical protein